jgi:broad specificity phosphatase PhoE
LGAVHQCSALQEINCGTLDGLPLDQVQRSHRDLWRANQLQLNEDFRWPGGESYREFRRRCLIAVRTLARKHPQGRIALVTHAGVISQVMGFLMGATPAQWERYRVGNTAATEIDWERGGGRVVRFDDQDHLGTRIFQQTGPEDGGSAPERVRPTQHPEPFSRGVRCA